MTKSELENCILQYGTEIYSFCRSITFNVQEADDLFQDTFLKATELLGEMDPANNPKSYQRSRRRLSGTPKRAGPAGKRTEGTPGAQPFFKERAGNFRPCKAGYSGKYRRACNSAYRRRSRLYLRSGFPGKAKRPVFP